MEEGVGGVFVSTKLLILLFAVGEVVVQKGLFGKYNLIRPVWAPNNLIRGLEQKLGLMDLCSIFAGFLGHSYMHTSEK